MMGSLMLPSLGPVGELGRRCRVRTEHCPHAAFSPCPDTSPPLLLLSAYILMSAPRAFSPRRRSLKPEWSQGQQAGERGSVPAVFFQSPCCHLAITSGVYLQDSIIFRFDTCGPECTQCCKQASLKPVGSFFRFPVLLSPPANHPNTLPLK